MMAAAHRFVASALVFAIGATAAIGAQGRRGGGPAAPRRPGTVERFSLGGKDVAVYLPGSHAAEPARRFPVVYLLGGYPIENLKLPEAADRLANAQGFSETIVVVPDASASSSSAEKFVVEDLVSYVDAHYRTIAARISRGLAGYSAGGFVALRIGMKQADKFSSLYVMNACCLTNDVLTSLDGAAANLQRYYALAVDTGTRDAQPLASNRQLHDAMSRLGIPHYYEEYDGESAGRIDTRLLPFFSRNLAAPANPTSPAVQ
jgi:enterochelin esterase-like enzyme